MRIKPAIHVVLLEDNVKQSTKLTDYENRPDARMSDDFMFRSVIRVTCFRFIWPGKVSTIFSREGVLSRIRYIVFIRRALIYEISRNRHDTAKDAGLLQQLDVIDNRVYNN